MRTVGRFETPLEFVKRNGPTLTHELGYRFGMRPEEALKIMKELERKGEVVSRRASFHWGAGREWRVISPHSKWQLERLLEDCPHLTREEALQVILDSGGV